MLDAKEVLAKVDIVEIISHYIPVVGKGKGLAAICPFHDDHDPSLSISREKQIFKCFVCGTSGNAINFVQKYENIPFREALEKVADIGGIPYEKQVVQSSITPEQQRMFDLNQEIMKYTNYELHTEQGIAGLHYLKERQIPLELADHYHIGYLSDSDRLYEFLSKKGFTHEEMMKTGIFNEGRYSFLNKRIVFPITTKQGKIAGFTARKITESDTYAKYLNSKESEIFHKANLIYHFPEALQEAKGRKIILVEGTMDVIGLGRIGVDSAVAPLGTSFTMDHAAAMKDAHADVTICYDGDRAGRNATVKTYRLLRDLGLTATITILPQDMDPDEMSKQDAKGLRLLLQEKNNLFDFYLKTMPVFENFQQKQEFLLCYLKDLGKEDVLLQDEYIHRLSDQTQISYSVLKEKLDILCSVNRTEHKQTEQSQGKQSKHIRRRETKALLKFDIKNKLEYRKEITRNYDRLLESNTVTAFDQNQILQSRVEILEKYLYLKGPVIETTITFLDNENDIDYRAQAVCEDTVKELCIQNKIAQANVNYVAFLHKDTSYPHLHIQVWQKAPYLSSYQLTSEFHSKLQSVINALLEKAVDVSVNPLMDETDIDLKNEIAVPIN